jgi:hypothetical protein
MILQCVDQYIVLGIGLGNSLSRKKGRLPMERGLAWITGWLDLTKLAHCV